MGFERLLMLQIAQITTLVVIVWVATRTIARNHAHLSYVLWLVVVLKCVTPPIWSSPIGLFSWLCASDAMPHDRLVLTDYQGGLGSDHEATTGIGAAAQRPSMPFVASEMGIVDVEIVN